MNLCKLCLMHKNCQIERRANESGNHVIVCSEIIGRPESNTRFDKLREMSAEEFAGWIAEHIDCFNCPNPMNGCSENDDTCAAAWLDWLMKEEE